MTKAFLLEGSILGAGALCGVAGETVEVHLAGEWTASVAVAGEPRITSVLEISKPDMITVAYEKYDNLPDFNPEGSGWGKGVALKGVKAAECTVRGALDPASLKVQGEPDPAAETFQAGVDYDGDLEWGSLGRLPLGAIRPDQPVWISYRYAKERLDSIVLTADGKIALKAGEPRTVMPEMPALAPGETRLANVYISGRPSALTDDNLFPVLEAAYPEEPKSGASAAEKLLPKTLEKLRSGEPLKILAWGDSVTEYGWYQTMFVERLKAEFPQAKIELVTEAWAAHNTAHYLDEPPGSEHNYEEKVLAQKPDLIISEFVNDASLNEQQVVMERYCKFLTDFKNLGAEWIILTPHYIRPDWMDLERQQAIDDDPRLYVQGLRIFAEEHHVALADASLRYGRLWRQGIPYLTLMENNINHPNRLGHTIFADSLMALFR